MSDKKKDLKDILPESEKKNIDNYPDVLKDSIDGLQDKRQVGKDD